MSNIDEEAKNNFTIEMRIFENYEKVKYEIIKVIDFLRHAETNLGMCRIWMEELEMYYLFFYEIRNNRRVLGKNRVKKILDILL